MAFDGSSGLAIVSDPHLDGLVAPPYREGDVVAGLPSPDLGAQLRRRRHGCSVDRDDHVAGVEGGRRGHVGRHRRDEDATRRRGDVVPQLAQRDHGCGLLRPRHVRCVLAIALRVRLTRRCQDFLGDEGRAFRPGERQELLEQADPAYEEVDVVDVALGTRATALDLDLVRERLGPIGDEEVVVRREPPQDEGRDEAEQAEHDCGAGEPLHGRATTARASARRRRVPRCR